MASQLNDAARIAELEAKVAALAERESAQKPQLTRLLKYAPWLMASHLLVGAPALLISLVVAYGTFVQAEATQKMQQADAWPFVSYGSSNANDKGERIISLNLANNGVGPALLGPMEIRYNGRPMRSPIEILKACCGLAEGTAGFSMATSPVTGIALPTRERTEFLRLPETPSAKPLWAKFERERWKLQVKSCYCSVFDDCWIIQGSQAKPQPVKVCPTNWVQFQVR